MQGLCSMSAHLWASEKVGVRQPKATAQNEPRSRPKLHQGPHYREARWIYFNNDYNMRH